MEINFTNLGILLQNWSRSFLYPIQIFHNLDKGLFVLYNDFCTACIEFKIT